ncbi:TA system VapC family ribonuclease toxin [Euzebya tangerina]|uniref:TA system VapC family ribonuclease toxin n=1 Tax=Euzebya tangerina TaxID=591198 RepID=UPI0023E8C117|nr:TA system VapC family ribonuclease toxin [Euzebya tangerina]
MSLLDANVLIAATESQHVHHDLVATHVGVGHPFATCPMTQGALLRYLVRMDHSAAESWQVLSQICAHPDHEFWPDLLGFDVVPAKGIQGHREITDAYLAALARANDGRVLTLDRGLATAQPDVTDLISP